MCRLRKIRRTLVMMNDVCLMININNGTTKGPQKKTQKTPPPSSGQIFNYMEKFQKIFPSLLQLSLALFFIKGNRYTNR